MPNQINSIYHWLDHKCSVRPPASAAVAAASLSTRCSVAGPSYSAAHKLNRTALGPHSAGCKGSPRRPLHGRGYARRARPPSGTVRLRACHERRAAMAIRGNHAANIRVDIPIRNAVPLCEPISLTALCPRSALLSFRPSRPSDPHFLSLLPLSLLITMSKPKATASYSSAAHAKKAPGDKVFGQARWR